MGLYFFSILSSFVLSFSKREKIIDSLFFFFLFVFLCFGYMTGSDWPTYEEFYKIGFIKKHVEPGYMFLSNFLSSVGVKFWFFHVTLKIVSLFVIVKFIFRNNEEDAFFSLMFFIASFGFFLFINCPFRNLIAMSIFIMAAAFLEKKKYIKFVLIVLVASTIHLVSILLLPLVLVKFMHKVKTTTFGIVFVSLYLFLLLGGFELLMTLFENIFPALYGRVEFYLDKTITKSSMFSPGLILRLICLVFMLILRDNISKKYERGALVFNLAFIYIIFSLLTYAFPLLFRLAIFLSPFYVIMLGLIAKELKPSSGKLFKFFYFFAALFITWVTITGKPYYIPYTNIVPYFFKGDYPDYEYRKQYNIINSPYSKENVKK